MTKNIPIVGATYGMWTVVSTKIKRHTNRSTYWQVQCQCGEITYKHSSTLIHGKTKSCKSCCKTNNNLNTCILRYWKKVKIRASNKQLEFTISPEFLQELYEIQNRKCALSQLPIEFSKRFEETKHQSASLDRIDNTKGYTEDNIQWVHKDINFMKGSLEQNYFIELCQQVVSVF